MSIKNKGNQKSDNSKVWMEDALLNLMETEAYSEITVQEITDNSGLSRRSFYRNYSSKDEILEGILLKIWREYEADIRLQSDLSLPNVAKVFFTIMERHVDFLKLMNRHRLLPLFFSEIDELLPTAFNEIKGATIPFCKESVSYALTFSTGGFLRILIKWLNEDNRKSPDEMSSIIKDIVQITNYPNM